MLAFVGVLKARIYTHAMGVNASPFVFHGGYRSSHG